MKILVLCYEYPPVGGGGGRVAAQVAAGLVRRGHSVRVHTAGMPHLPRREVRDGVEILRSPSLRRREDTCSVPEMALYLATCTWPAARLAREWQPDVLHAHFAVPTGAAAVVASQWSGRPFVLTAHLGDVPGGVPEQTAGLFRWVKPFAQWIWRRAARVTAVSRHVAGLAASAYGVRPDVILNGLPARAPCPIAIHAPPKILFIGRLSVQKDPLLAIQALQRLLPLDWTCEVIGEGPLGADMREAARALGDRVTFRGWLDAGEAAAAMATADILLMTSRHEGLPMVAVEALQNGLAIVGSDVGGMHDVLVDGENGFLCPRDPAAFANALEKLLRDHALLARMRAASLERFPAFDLETSLDAYEDVLLAAARRRPLSSPHGP